MKLSDLDFERHQIEEALGKGYKFEGRMCICTLKYNMLSHLYKDGFKCKCNRFVVYAPRYSHLPFAMPDYGPPLATIEFAGKSNSMSYSWQ